MAIHNKSRLPNEYQEVEYLQSNGKQIIDTGFCANQDTSMLLDMEVTSLSYTDIWGSFQSGATRRYELYKSGNYMEVGYEGVYYNVKILDTERHTWEYRKNVFYCDDIPLRTFTYKAFQQITTLYLFAMHRYTGQQATFPAQKVYRHKILDDGTLIRDFVPCYRKADNEAGMFDIVNNVFYTNIGSGAFSVGNNIN